MPDRGCAFQPAKILAAAVDYQPIPTPAAATAAADDADNGYRQLLCSSYFDIVRERRTVSAFLHFKLAQRDIS